MALVVLAEAHADYTLGHSGNIRRLENDGIASHERGPQLERAYNTLGMSKYEVLEAYIEKEELLLVSHKENQDT